MCLLVRHIVVANCGKWHIPVRRLVNIGHLIHNVEIERYMDARRQNDVHEIHIFAILKRNAAKK